MNTPDTFEENKIDELEEYDLHREDCQVHIEDECTCDLMGMKDFIRTTIAEARTKERERIKKEIYMRMPFHPVPAFNVFLKIIEPIFALSNKDGDK